MKLILASASPRRTQILRDAGIAFEVCPTQVDETRLPNEPAEAMVARLAEAKARALPAEAWAKAGDNVLIIAADTCVELDGTIFGKPRDAAHAREILAALSGRTHRVLTGIAALSLPAARTSEREASVPADSPAACGERFGRTIASTQAVEITLVTFAPLTPAQIDAYIAIGEPLDKAGAYAIQGRAARYIPRIEGCYFNVVGLPLARLIQLLHSLGWTDTPG